MVKTISSHQQQPSGLFVRQISEHATKTFVNEKQQIACLEFGTLAVVGDSSSLKHWFIKEVIETDLNENRNLVTQYEAKLKPREVAEQSGSNTKRSIFPRYKSAHLVNTRAKMTFRERTTRRVRTLFSRKVEVKQNMAFRLLDIDVDLRKNALITYRASLAEADAILFFLPESQKLRKIKDCIKEMISLRKNPDVKVIVVSDQGADIKELCEKNDSTCLVDLTSLKTGMKESDERVHLYLDKINVALFSTMNHYLKEQEKKDAEDMLYMY